MPKLKPDRKRTKVNQVVAAPASMASPPGRTTAPQMPALHSQIFKIINYLNATNRDQFRLRFDGRTISVEVTALESQVVLSSVKPLSPQLVEEFTRVSAFFGYLAKITDDSDWCEDERDAYEIFETWKRIVHGGGGLTAMM